ncbi:MAG: adenylate/guanylate cyclase domain-containing protein [Oculatellaceae cyanobacterium bins.114]|nr:adenylate/guanylate cyclase domain-containing protein [Oculatellaceae cyanobacterium bins.114]
MRWTGRSPNWSASNTSQRHPPKSGWLNLTRLSYLLVGVWASIGAIATAINFIPALALERQTQIFFFSIRGKVTPPDNIVILSMDQESLAQGETYQRDPTRYPELAPIETWPWRRAAYANVIEKLLAAGARSVSIDVILADPSSYGLEDDQTLRDVIRRHPNQVVLANSYETFGTPETGELGQIVNPNPDFEAKANNLGLINFAADPDGRVYRFSEVFINQVVVPQDLGTDIVSFATATVQIHRLSQNQSIEVHPAGENIFFYGPPTTFKRIPFWHVLDSTNWEFHLREQTFRDKIVLIGPTASYFQDFVRTPFSETMPGVELHANAIASLLDNRAINEAIPSAPLRGLVVLIGVAGTGFLFNRFLKRTDSQMLMALGVALTWAILGYISFVFANLIMPTAVPVIAIVLSGLSSLTTGAISNRLEQLRLRQTLERYVAAPIVHEILTNYSEAYQALLKGRKVKAAVLFCDIRGFTSFSLQLEPEQLVEQLNDYLNAMVEAILDAGGTVDKFIGDAVMAEFGSPISEGEKTDALNAVRAALGMRQALVNLHQQWQQQGKVLFFNGIGINFGEALAGDIGSVRRREYALIGDAVNVASRVEGLTRKFWTDILITESLYELVKDEVEAVCVGEHELKGRGQNVVQLYSLIGLKGGDQTSYRYIHDQLRNQKNLKESHEA